MKTSKKLICAALALITLGGLSGCGQNNSTETKNTEVSANTNASAGELKELDVVLDWYPNAVHAFIYDAIEKGYYEEEGLKVNIQFPSNANDALSLVAAKKQSKHSCKSCRLNRSGPDEYFPFTERKKYHLTERFKR